MSQNIKNALKNKDKGVVLADSTRVKAGSLERGEVAQVVMSPGRKGFPKTLLGFDMGRDWNPLMQIIQQRSPALLVTDGDDPVASAHSRLASPIPRQRCQWHMAHQGRHFLFQGGLAAKYHKPFLRRVKKILFQPQQNPQRKWETLIRRLKNAGLHETAAHFRNAAPFLWTHQMFRHAVPTTTSLVEREMREINRRTDVGVRWSVPGVRNLLNLNLGVRYRTASWENLTTEGPDSDERLE